MLEVEVDDLCERVHLRGLEVAYEFVKTFLELGIYIIVSLSQLNQHRLHLQTTGSKQFWPSMVRLA
jgi:hypothetical protein